MVRSPLGIIVFLVSIEALVLFVSSRPRWKKYFSFLPPVFWIYFIPMIVSSLRLLDPFSPVYAQVMNFGLPASLILLLLSTDVPQVFSLGRKALTMMLAGSFGIVLGTVLVVFLLKRFLGPDAWAGFGALSASWTGGSANMIAVKEALSAPDKVFTPMVIVDTIVPYTWMGILMALAGHQAVFDRWNRAEQGVLDELRARVTPPVSALPVFSRFEAWLRIGMITIGGTFVCAFAAVLIPEIPYVISSYGWMIILASSLGILISFTRARALGESGATRAGYYLLYFVLTTIGARASFARPGSALLFIAAGFMIVLVHTGVLVAVGRAIRAPLFLLACASQANLGGVASAPAVAAMYQPGLASVGLLMAILGNIIGTYVGILTGRLCYFFAGGS